MPASATSEPRIEESAGFEERELTPAQKKRGKREEREEREKKLRKAKKRQVRCRETPALIEGSKSALREVLSTYKRPAYPAYDDSPRKRRKVNQRPKVMRLVRRASCASKPRLNKSPSPSPASTSTLDQLLDPRSFTDIPTEIIDEILRYILLWPHDIVVFNGWSRVFPRSRPRLNLSILYTCQMLRDQGMRVLYGENKFEYNLRDPSASHHHTEPVLDMVFANSVVPINEYGHLIRYIKIKVDRSRLHFEEYRQNFERAILKFLPGGDLARPANLHTLTLEVPALRNCDLHNFLEPAPTEQDPNKVPICRYFQEDSRVGDALFKIPIQWVRVLAWDRDGEGWETEFDLRYFHKDEQMRLEHRGLSNDKKQSTVCGANNPSFEMDSGAAISYRTKDVEVMEKLWGRKVEDAVTELRNLAGRIELLANNPDLAVGQLGLWRSVNTPSSHNPENNDGSGLMFLPSNWRESSTRTNMRSSRGRTAPARSNLATNLRSKTSTKSKAKSRAKANTKARTTTKTSLDDLSILNAKDTTRETKLLEAQQGIQEEETEPGRSGMLTAGWLENLPEYDVEDVGGPVHGHDLETSSLEVEPGESNRESSEVSAYQN
ncbi:hypothetical protein F5Y12DRAFT_411257 [Xylaria sp. FL1777]|nr:hypothetical protein F5Y12DRAFT_411257 [Xylaria sp. FL1777]